MKPHILINRRLLDLANELAILLVWNSDGPAFLEQHLCRVHIKESRLNRFKLTVYLNKDNNFLSGWLFLKPDQTKRNPVKNYTVVVFVVFSIQYRNKMAGNKLKL